MEDLHDRTIIAVIGAGDCTQLEGKLAYDVGHFIAQKDCILVCGGLSGCMENAAQGVKEEGGITIGVIPGYDKSAANPSIDIVIATGMGHARNAIVVATADAAIAVGGSHGTLSEIALARKMGKPVVSLGSWEFADKWEETAGVFKAETPEEAVEIAIREAAK